VHRGGLSNWSEFLCKDSLENCLEAQEQGKTFHYAWLLLSIVLVTGELSDDSQFPTIYRNLLKAMKYASLWAMKDANWIHDSKIFSMFMEMNIRMGIKRKSWLSPTIYNSLQCFAEFKVDLHSIDIRVHKGPTKQWKELPFVAMKDVIFDVLEWPPEWRAPDIAAMEKSTVQKNKEETKLRMVQLVEKRRKEVVVAKAQEVQDTA